MTHFIKLIECDGRVLILNTDRIEHICLGAKGFDTYVKLLGNPNNKSNENMGKENYFFVKESIEDIWIALNVDQNVTYDVDIGKDITTKEINR